MGVFVYYLLLPLVTGVVCHVTMATTVLGNNILYCIDYSSWKSLQNTHNLGYAFNITTVPGPVHLFHLLQCLPQ